jgi:hypothetical protein
MAIRLVVTLTAAALLICSACVHAREVWERDWIEVRTPNFVFVSTLSEKRTIGLARRLENFRSLIVSLTSPQRANTRVPFEIYLFQDALPEIGLTPDLGGYFLSTRAANMIVLRRNWNLNENIQHEYVHFLLRNRGGRGYPSWLDEGTAELLSTLELDGAVFNLGKPPRLAIRRLGSSRWLDYSTILALRDPRELEGVQRVMFYNQSWLLLHYLKWGMPDRSYPRDTGEYLRRVATGTASDVAFAESFGVEIDGLARELRAHAARLGYTQGALAAPPAETEISLRELQPDEVVAAIGKIALGRGDLAGATALQSALRKGTD